MQNTGYRIRYIIAYLRQHSTELFQQNLSGRGGVQATGIQSVDFILKLNNLMNIRHIIHFLTCIATATVWNNEVGNLKKTLIPKTFSEYSHSTLLNLLLALYFLTTSSSTLYRLLHDARGSILKPQTTRHLVK